MAQKNYRIIAAACLASLLVVPASAFKPGIHKDISGEAMDMVTAVVDSGRTINFTDKAKDQVKWANWRTDIGSGFFVGENHFTEDLFSASSGRLVRLKGDIVTEITATEPDGEAARKILGTALHTIQDFYAHSNWIERGNGSILSTLGRSSLPNPSATTAVCPGDPEVLPAGGGVLLTTGFYERLFGCGPIRTPGKCYHGNVPAGCDGIHKDKPGRDFHGPARDLAVQASLDYIQQILDDPAVAGNDLAKKCLLGVANGTLGVVIDDTGSMGPEISGVKSQVTAIVNSVRGTDDEPKQYLLVRFGDPDVGPPSTTSDPDTFLGRVNSLSPGGGGDCPELSMRALLQAIGVSLEESTLFLFTDASAKDASLFRGVIASANAKRIRITPLLTGSCSPVDPAYVAIAEETGGLLFFLSQFELSSAFDLVKPQLRDDFVTILLAKDTIAAEMREFEVPIDSTVEQAVFAVSIDFKDTIALLDPAGIPVAPGDPGVTVTSLSTGAIFTVEAPATGLWTLQASGTGDLSISANANSPINFQTFQFVERVNPIHEALAAIAGQPIVGSTPLGLAALLGSFSDLEFELVDLSGASLGPIDLMLGDEDAAADEYVGDVPLPSTSFRVSVAGLDGAGLPFKRLFPPTFLAQTVAVGVDLSAVPDTLPAGVTTTIEFTVENLGATDVFSILASDSQGFLSRVDPTSVSLVTGGQASVEVDLTVPAGTPEGTPVVLTLTATSTTDPTITNSAALELSVLANQAPDCSAAMPSADALWPPNHSFVAIDVLGVSDPDGDPVEIAITGITQDEAVDAPGSGDTAPDGEGVGSATAAVRAERAGGGDGRVYAIAFGASDGNGGTCSGEVRVGVPHSRNDTALDSGQNFDSTVVP